MTSASERIKVGVMSHGTAVYLGMPWSTGEFARSETPELVTLDYDANGTLIGVEVCITGSKSLREMQAPKVGKG